MTLKAPQTYHSPLWPCGSCGGTERYSRGRACVQCTQGYKATDGARHRWDAKKKSLLVSMREDGAPWDEICKATGMSEAACRTMCHQLSNQKYDAEKMASAAFSSPPGRVHEDPLKPLEDDAYQLSEKAEDSPAQYRGEYAHIGPAVYEPPFRARTMREWPAHTDFRPDELVGVD